MAAYYNENDPDMAGGLRELIKAGLIPSGEVDERSIEDVQPEDVRGSDQCHFFSGIGGWPRALLLVGWPDDRPVWTGSCPCPSFSSAGNGKGFDDPRGQLWFAWLRLIRVCRPVAIFGEQVDGAIRHGWLDRVRNDLEAEGYACGGHVLPACGAGAPHLRHRLFWVSYACESTSEWNARGLPAPEAGISGKGFDDGNMPVRLAIDGPTDRLRDSQGDGREPRRAESGRGSVAERRGAVVGLDHGQEPRLEGHAGPAGAWSDFAIVHCRDGKCRRTPDGYAQSVFQPVPNGLPGGMGLGDLAGGDEPEIIKALEGFPLAGRITGRVALLRGAGNAIVPQVAAQFILAAEEARAEMMR